METCIDPENIPLKDDTNESSISARQNVSFKFIKHGLKKLSGSNKLEEKSAAKEACRNIVLSTDGEIPKKKSKKDLIIPKKKDTRYANLKQTEGQQNKSTDENLSELALKEILQESAAKNENWENREYTMATPLALKKENEVHIESEIPSEATIEEYENTPIVDFGRAVLRGLGVKNEDLYKVIEPKQHPSWLGIGTNIPSEKHNNQQEDDDVKITKGAYVHVSQGPYKGCFGQVESLDPDLSRVFIKLTTGESISVKELYVEVISKDKFKKECRTINKDVYEEYVKVTQTSSNPEPHHKEKNNKNEVFSSRRKDHSSFIENANKIEPKRHKESKKEHKLKSHTVGYSNKTWKQHIENTWAHPQLKVRFIDKQFKNGKYFNQKMVIEDVLSPENCACRTEDGRYIEDISQEMLETVIPRYSPSYVMIVQGKYKGQLAAVLDRDKTNCLATVQFLSNREKVTKLDYDCICEYVGDITTVD